ncbi:sugar transferase [Shigella sonnei]|uniref:sugar transferase n=2 Tax=Shigella sonnei TaxID=624 RepID=UPI000663A783|nr:sugar transferase [Shigella sonnei]EFB8956169.1 sugar transferase [Escherichia coli]EAA2193899.1 sugar transferase [Shigella sonnei]EAB8511497.1 sugar transferase [Shigella sonnei]EAC0063050.1 sugar transferase [Shigella sonnei]EFB9003738.1 sugar transferase [Escherichia coli]
MKRIFDVIVAGLGLLFLFPVFIIVSMLIVADSKGGGFFRQYRVGRFGKDFRIHKFRTMFIDSEKKGRITVGQDARVTRVGWYLRKYKIDELPQLIDVLSGTMSLVGPRPEVREFIDEYPDDIREKVLSVRPGITDLASIEMVDENEILSSYDDPRRAYIDIILPIKQRYYLDYVANNSVKYDCVIIWKTIIKILSR